MTLLALVAAHSARVAHLRQVHRTTEAAAHSLQVTAGLEALLAALAAAESAERGFVITGDAAYLETYEAARSRVAPDIEALRSLTADNPGHQDDIGRLAAAASAKLADVAEVVRRRRESGFTAAQAEVADGPGRRLMDGARAIVARMAAREEAVLASRTRQATDNSRSALLSRYVTSGVAVLALLLLFAGTRAFGAERRRAARARADREHISQQLAAIVESSEDAIVGMDLEGTITAWNPAAERMYGFTADDMIGTAIRRMVPDGRVAEEDASSSASAAATGCPISKPCVAGRTVRSSPCL